MRSVIYARYSTDLQRNASIEDQVRSCEARIKKEGWIHVGTFTDHAVSGSIRLRSGYQKLLEQARDGNFDVVVAEALDRLSRDQEDVAALYKHLSFSGVTLFTLAEGEINELHVGLKGTMNALFLKDLAIKTHRGLEGRIRQGRSAGGRVYGYDVVRETDGAAIPSMADGESVSMNPRSYAVSSNPLSMADLRRLSRGTSMPKESPVRAVGLGRAARSRVTADAATASCATNSISAVSSGTASIS